LKKIQIETILFYNHNIKKSTFEICQLIGPKIDNYSSV